VLVTPVGDQADEHIVKLVASQTGKLSIADQVGGYLTAAVAQVGANPGSWGTWQLTVSGGSTPQATAAPQLHGFRLTAAPRANYQQPASSPADDPCRPVFRFDVTDAAWTNVLAAGQATAQLPAMTVQGSSDGGASWQDLGQLMSSTTPTVANGRVVTVGPASFYFQNKADTAVAPAVEPTGQHQCSTSGSQPVTEVRVVSGDRPSKPMSLAGLGAPPVNGGSNATPLSGLSATTDTPGAATPRANGVNQAGLTLALKPSGSGGEIDTTDPRYQLVYYRSADTHALVTGLYQPGDYGDYIAVGPWATVGGTPRPTRRFVVTTNPADQSLNAVMNDTGTQKDYTANAFTVEASNNPLAAAGTATGGISVSGCAANVGAVCTLAVPSNTVPALYQAGNSTVGPVIGLQQAPVTAITGRSSLPLQVGSANAHQLGSASLNVTAAQAKLLDTSQFFPSDTVDSALVTSGELVAALDIQIGNGS
jgi:hypothetical protein